MLHVSMTIHKQYHSCLWSLVSWALWLEHLAECHWWQHRHPGVFHKRSLPKVWLCSHNMYNVIVPTSCHCLCVCGYCRGVWVSHWACIWSHFTGREANWEKGAFRGKTELSNALTVKQWVGESLSCQQKAYYCSDAAKLYQKARLSEEMNGINMNPLILMQ